MKKKKPLSRRDVLAKGATPTEVKIFEIVQKIHKETGLPVSSGEIIEVEAETREDKRHRTGLTVLLNSMIEKGLIVKPSHKFYIPA